MTGQYDLTTQIPMTVKVSKSGGGYVIRISSDIAKFMKIKDDDMITAYIQKVVYTDE